MQKFASAGGSTVSESLYTEEALMKGLDLKKSVIVSSAIDKIWRNQRRIIVGGQKRWTKHTYFAVSIKLYYLLIDDEDASLQVCVFVTKINWTLASRC